MGAAFHLVHLVHSAPRNTEASSSLSSLRVVADMSVHRGHESLQAREMFALDKTRRLLDRKDDLTGALMGGALAPPTRTRWSGQKNETNQPTIYVRVSRPGSLMLRCIQSCRRGR